MGNSSEGTTGTSLQGAKNNEGKILSLRKLAANRQNALKSSGPKTTRGKAFSRMNAWKHGLLAAQFSDFQALGEDPVQYGELLEGLRAQFQPVGSAEELEVQRIAQCWWRLKRASRYENAVNRVAVRDLGTRELAEQDEFCKERKDQEKAAVQMLQSAEAEIEAAGEIPQQLKERISALLALSEEWWRTFEIPSQEQAVRSKIVPRPTPKRRASVLAQITAGLVIRHLEHLAESRADSVLEIVLGQHMIPNRNSLDKLLRYETTIERNLGRSLERLERLQRRRPGENGPSTSGLCG